MSWSLGIDSSTVELGLGLAFNGAPVASCSRYVVNSHAEHINGAVEYLLHSNKLCAANIERVAVAVGPGSFTGLRIGLAFVKGMFFRRSVVVLPLSSLESTALAYPAIGSQTTAVAFDARRGDVYFARFQTTGTGLIRLTDDTLTPFADFSAALEPGDTVITDCLGYGKSTVFDALANREPRTLRVETMSPQRGLALALAASKAPANDPRFCAPPDVLPRYIRLSAPEERSLGTGA